MRPCSTVSTPTPPDQTVPLKEKGKSTNHKSVVFQYSRGGSVALESVNNALPDSSGQTAGNWMLLMKSSIDHSQHFTVKSVKLSLHLLHLKRFNLFMYQFFSRAELSTMSLQNGGAASTGSSASTGVSGLKYARSLTQNSDSMTRQPTQVIRQTSMA